MEEFIALKCATLFKHRGDPIHITLFQKHGGDVIFGIPNVKKRLGASIFQNIKFVESCLGLHFRVFGVT